MASISSENSLANGSSGIGIVNGTAHKGLKVLIAGAGIGGLAAAIALRQQGHHVEVHEQSRFANEVGAAIHMTPNAMSALKYIGIDPRDSGAVPLIQTRYLSADNNLLRIQKYADEAGRWQNPWLLAHRAHFHTQLKIAAISKDRPGEPVRVHTSSSVVSADTHATIILADGSTQSADVVIGADGVHSKTRAGLLQCPPQTFKTHSSAFRFILQRKHVLSDPETKGLVEVDGSMDMWYGADRKIVLYPTFNNTLLNFVCVHPGQLSETTDSYDRSASKAALLEVYKDFHPRIRALLNKVDPADLKVYPFFDLERLPTFASERMALIGDAAHPFTPHLAQGGAMALEDAVSLAIMLEKSVTSAEVPLRLQLYNQARYERTSTIQEYSRQVGGDGVGSNADADTVATFKGHEYRDYGLSHDEVHSSTNLLRNHKWKTRGGGVRWRQPMVFGPLPGPRQDASGNPYTESLRDSTKTIMTILFTTSGTLLRNLLPNDRYYFESKDTVAKASFSFESLQNMAWLGGGGYELLALYIHGVCHKGSDGRVRKGNYCPIMFENLADPILTGREELGIPKVFSDMEMSRDATSFRSNMSWRGAHWGTLDLAGLQATEEDPTKVDGGEGLLVHKYIPSPEIGKPDADYDILHVMDPRPFVKAVLATDPKSVRMEILDRGQKLLPTLHPIISRLAELPIFEIVGASVKEVQGVADLSNIIRLD